METNERTDPACCGAGISGNGPYIEPETIAGHIPLSIHGTIKHQTGVPAENIGVSLEISHGGEGGLSMNEITGRDGRVSFGAMEIHAPPDNFVVRGELLERLSQQPLRDARVSLTIRAGETEQKYRATSDFRGRFAAEEERRLHEWFRGWDNGYP